MSFVINEHPYIGLEGSPELGFHWRIEELEPDDGVQLLAPPIARDTDRIGIFVANWIIVAVYTVIWIVALVIWQRRKHRMMSLLS